MPRDLFFDDLQQLIDDVQHLRGGYTKEANWNLPQICHHIHLVPQRWLGMPASDAPDTELQKQYKPHLASVLAARQLPGKLESPPMLVPPADTSESAIDALIAFVRDRIRDGFPAMNHRLFGNLTPRQAEQMMMIHSANHLRFLHPAL